MNLKKHIILLFIIFLVVNPLLAQENIDSLENIWQDKNQIDSLRFEALDILAWDIYKDSKPDSAFYFAQKMLELAEQKQNKNYQALAFHIQGTIHRKRGNWSQALIYYQKSLKISEKKNLLRRIASSYSGIATLYKYQKNYNLALQYNFKSKAIYEQINYQQGISNLYNNIGNIYFEKGHLDTAMIYYQKSKAILIELKNEKSLPIIINNIADIYYKKNKYDTALYYYKNCLKICRKYNIKSREMANLIDIGNIYKQTKNYEKAIQNYIQAIEIAELTENPWVKEKGNYGLYEIYKKLGNLEKALFHFEQYDKIDETDELIKTNQQLLEIEYAKIQEADSLKQAIEIKNIELNFKEETRQRKYTRNIILGISFLILVLALSLFGRLQYTRNAKKEIEKEKEKSDDLLLNILPKEVAEELKLKGEANAKRFDNVSILFTDFKDFTEKSASFDAEDLVKEINIYFKKFDEIILNHGIEKIKTIGDSYMAAGNIPSIDSNYAKNTVLAAIEMQNFVKEKTLDSKKIGKLGFEMRLGIHVGPVVAGVVGIKKFQYDIWGDTVNIASRMESNGLIGKINISEKMYEIIKNIPDFSFEKRGEISVKGKGKMNMYLVDTKN